MLGGKAAEAEAEAAGKGQPPFTKDSSGATTDKATVAATSAERKQAPPSTLQAATSVLKPVTKSDYRSFGGGGARWKAEATKQRIRSTVVSSAVFRNQS